MSRKQKLELTWIGKENWPKRLRVENLPQKPPEPGQQALFDDREGK